MSLSSNHLPNGQSAQCRLAVASRKVDQLANLHSDTLRDLDPLS